MGEGNFFFVGPGFFLQPGKITVSQKDVQGKDTFLLCLSFANQDTLPNS